MEVGFLLLRLQCLNSGLHCYGMVFGRKSLTLTESAVFMRQLAALVRAGLPLLRSLEILIAQEKDTGFGRVLRALAAEVRSGDAFSDALMRHPESFDALFVHMVKAGEVGGTLSRTLTYLSRFLERSLRMRSQICSALLYPMVVIVISVAVILFLTLGVVPKFQMLFEDMLKGGFASWTDSLGYGVE